MARRSRTTRLEKRSLTLALPLLALVLGALLPYPVFAEFFKTGNFTYQSFKDKIIISLETPGLFIHSGKPIEPQEFDPAQLKTDKDSNSLFIAFDPSTGRYDKIITPKATYAVNGNLTLITERLRIAVDNKNQNNPYLSIVSLEDSSLLGFSGTEQVLSGSEATTTLLEANQFDYDWLAPYRLSNAGVLTLRGKEVTRDTIGLAVEPPQNLCLKGRESGRVVYLTPELLRDVWSIPGKIERVEALRTLVKKEEQNDRLNNAIFLTITNDIVISFHLDDGTIRTTKILKRRLFGKTLCLVDLLEL